MVKNPPAMQEPWFHPWVRKIPWPQSLTESRAGHILPWHPSRTHPPHPDAPSADLEALESHQPWLLQTGSDW